MYSEDQHIIQYGYIFTSLADIPLKYPLFTWHTRAHQHSIKFNTADVFNRMLAMTHPLIASKRRKIICSLCSEEGHSCKSIKFHGFGPKEFENSLIEEYYIEH